MTTPLIDSLGMWDAAANLPEQVEQAASSAVAMHGLPVRIDIENIVILGMGGSGITGDVLLSIAGPFLAVPVVVIKSYTVPAFVGPTSLVFAVSYSGNTEEILEAVTIAAEQGAQIIVITSGGDLDKYARSADFPVIAVPGEIPQPRAAIGAMAIPPLVVLEEIGLFPGATHWIDLAVAQLKRRRDQLLLEGSVAQQIAESIANTVPMFISSAALGLTSVMRWKAQINENVKMPAFYSVFPEGCHNEITGWEALPDEATAFSMVVLRHEIEHPQLARRFYLGKELLAPKVKTYLEHHAEGEGELAQLLDLFIVGDFVSLEVAKLLGVDPGPIPVLSSFKERLKG